MVMMTAGEKTWQQKSQVLTGKLARRRRKILKIGAQNAFLVREISPPQAKIFENRVSL
tara:strand:- start:331 stop:504 length:174 start_codon:yes stop_codon:yes gene_type:complete